MMYIFHSYCTRYLSNPQHISWPYALNFLAESCILQCSYDAEFLLLKNIVFAYRVITHVILVLSKHHMAWEPVSSIKKVKIPIMYLVFCLVFLQMLG